MAKATITINDLGDNEVNATIEFGDSVDQDSGAHRIAASAMLHIRGLHEGDKPAEFKPGAGDETRPHPVTGA